MTNLKKFYEELEQNKEMKQAVLKANEEAKGLNEEQIKEKLIETAGKFGYVLTKKDFEPEEGELEGKELEKVAGGVSAGCFFSNAGCTFIGEIDGSGGCILLGLY
ncbi:MAG: hypothetical protein PHG16_12660 [Lachnospiraceae bacterium]|nr:hypothetical protein [Lachnospiraceae bacterium]